MPPAPTDVLSALVGADVPVGSVALIGAVARNAWAPPRATTDLDVAIAASSGVIGTVEAALAGLGYDRVRSHRADPDDALADLLVFRAPGGGLRQVDLLVAKTLFEEEVLRRAVPVEIGGVCVPVATPEDLVVYKLVADRDRDREDVAAVVRTQTRAGRELDWAYIERWAGFWGVPDRLAALRTRERDAWE
jgi:predicted nucleotidyltransferase